MTKYLLVCLISSLSDTPATNRRVELLRESRRSSASSLQDVRPVMYRYGSYCETSSFVGSLKYVGIGRRDLWITFVPECSACVPMLELACSSSRRDRTQTMSASLGSDCGPECEGLVDHNLEQTVRRFQCS